MFEDEGGSGWFQRWHETQREFSELCRRIGLSPGRTHYLLLRRAVETLRDRVCFEFAASRGYIIETRRMTMPRPKRAPAPKPDDKQQRAAVDTAPGEDDDPLGALPGADDPLGGLDTEPGDGLDSLAEGVNRDSIAGAIRNALGGSTGGGSGPDPVTAQAILDLKESVDGFLGKLGGILEMFETLRDGQTALGKRLKAMAEDIGTGFTRLEQGHEVLREMVKGKAPYIATTPGSATSAVHGTDGQGVSWANGKTEQIIKILLPMVFAPGRPAYRAGDQAWSIFAQVLAKQGVSATPEEVAAAFASRIKDGVLVKDPV